MTHGPFLLRINGKRESKEFSRRRTKESGSSQVSCFSHWLSTQPAKTYLAALGNTWDPGIANPLNLMNCQMAKDESLVDITPTRLLLLLESFMNPFQSLFSPNHCECYLNYYFASSPSEGIGARSSLYNQLSKNALNSFPLTSSATAIKSAVVALAYLCRALYVFKISKKA